MLATAQLARIEQPADQARSRAAHAALVVGRAPAPGARTGHLGDGAVLADYEQVTLLPLPGAGVPERQELPIEGTLAGHAFRRVQVITSPADSQTRIWLPMLDGVERLGVVEMTLAAAPDAELSARTRAYVTLVAELVISRDAYSDCSPGCGGVGR